MNNWVAPIVVIICIILGSILFLTQSKGKETPNLPPTDSGFQTISLTPAQGQPAGSSVQGQQDQMQINFPGQQQQGQQQQGQQQQAPQQQTSAGSAQGQQQKQLEATYNATIKTTKGDIKVTLRADAAPNTVINFINKAETNYYNGLTFHRVEDWVVQGGDPKGNGTGGGQMQTELNVLPFKAGSLGVARGGNIQISNDSQFFITKTDASWLDQQYTNFGEVTEGMDVVNSMEIGDKILGIQVDGIN